MDVPKYNVGDVVYLRESAGIGHLETVHIRAVVSFQGSWAYVISTSSMNNISASTYSDRINYQTGVGIYYSQNELLTKAEALEMAIDTTTAKLTRLQELYNNTL